MFSRWRSKFGQKTYSVIGQGMANAVDCVVYVVPAEYSLLGEQDRYAIARLVGEMQASIREAQAFLGRIGE